MSRSAAETVLRERGYRLMTSNDVFPSHKLFAA
jgi:hypothetical protein